MSYLAECLLPSLRMEHVEGAAARARASARALRAEGADVVFSGSIYVPSDEMALYLFEGESAEVVAQACERAGIAIDRVLTAVERRVSWQEER